MVLMFRLFMIFLWCCVVVASSGAWPLVLRKLMARFEREVAEECDCGPVIFLDVDNTLYRDTLHGIEKQIIHGIHTFCLKYLNLSAEESDHLHVEHGSTIQGLVKSHQISRSQLENFYHEVYQPIDVSKLLHEDGIGSSTGYSHSLEAAERRTVRDLLTYSQSLLYVASNSPRYHVERVIHALGLSQVAFRGLITPESRPKHYPTKERPKLFFEKVRRDLIRLHPFSKQYLLDDSLTNTQAVEGLMQACLVNNGADGDSLVVALCRTLGFVPMNYTFSQVTYLRAKQRVDMASLNRETYMRMCREFEMKMASPRSDSVVIVDLGAGLLSTLRLFLFGHEDLPPLFRKYETSASNMTFQYVAYESNDALEKECLAVMHELGFELNETNNWSSEHKEYVFVCSDEQIKPAVVVHIRFWDFKQATSCSQSFPLLVTGCCFADLISPDCLIKGILERFPCCEGEGENILVYLPITFCGTTQFLPGQPSEKHNLANIRPVPSDTCAFACYSRALADRHNHHTDPDRLIEVVMNFGGKLLQRGTSDWSIDVLTDSYLWNAMMYFFGTVACPELCRLKWDGRAWIERARRKQPTICVSNVDLLFTLPPIGRWNFADRDVAVGGSSSSMYSEVEFKAPHVVGTISRTPSKLEPNQVRIRSLYSLISSGTELKIFTGNFDEAALDVNIKGLDKERMAYPISYGYSLVGTVVECGSSVHDSSTLLGKLVFSFSPHRSQAMVDRGAIHIVPDGIHPLDAIFMPSVETALSLVHDANPLVGERVIVFGQGLIGLLVTGLLAHSATLPFVQALQTGSTLTTVDAIRSRLAAAAMMGSHEVLTVDDLRVKGRFDVAIEVSGNGRALQSAIDATRDGGRVIIGSWYGKDLVKLHLGIDFHRSMKTLRVSQVSEIPAFLTSTWDKARRFQLAWDFVRVLRPSRLLSRMVRLEDAQEAFEALHEKKDVAIAFDYT